MAGRNDNLAIVERASALSEAFHRRIAQDALLRNMFPSHLDRVTEHLSLFLSERFGDSKEYTARRGKQSLICRHAHLAIGTPEAERWLAHMFDSIEEVGIGEPAAQRLRDYFTETAHTLTDPLILLYNLPLEELGARLDQNPALVRGATAGRDLLMEAAGRWDLPRVRLLLQYGADVGVAGLRGHGALYYATNAHLLGREADGCAVVELLIQGGADVNRQSGTGKMTPLHMTARRGNVALAVILLDAGAQLEIADSGGETPLRRAVNCSQGGMVDLLLARGADPLTRDKQGRSAHDAARHPEIRNALEKAIAATIRP